MPDCDIVVHFDTAVARGDRVATPSIDSFYTVSEPWDFKPSYLQVILNITEGDSC